MAAEFSDLDRRMMERALELAALGRYSTQPNPRVGCVVVQGDRIVGEGAHRKSGEAHAEPLALQAAGSAARDATVYVTLEPHCYHSRMPPCTDALIKAGVKRVVCASLDPNPKVHGAGMKQLQQAGVQTQTGLLEAQAHELNLGFEKRMISGLPRVIVKIAASLDGRVALANGESRWITGEAARADVQKLRAESSAVLTGIDTVIADDPQLTVRDASLETLGRQPLRVVLDSKLRMPATAKMLEEKGETIVFTAQQTGGEAIAHHGAKLIRVSADADGRVDLDHVLRELGTLQCNDVLVEAGPTLAGRLLQSGLADELIVYIAPVLLGPDARPMAQFPRLEKLSDRLQFALHRSETVGADLKLVLRPQTRTHSQKLP
ncbi:diaminohydroxyphosphoribosylaminopyrimidine deaminase/5-amino-6-(5-phosphoribosylamino)uracil reductase [Povalibacter uvarum]|uniref:Riboflavin biosynthesis protein RibD n=1 Tax=Povalibacter uvarum TaxID=732238 RepID=A0A841HGS0_9GAMM|nr:bifunctional diaminohydroxyphosphoribosylaminopyrimidine deaminase/5-amino-6-(5-phosphoribosylamino)uracil reductase RibD [Povalibacter uvarum]MBB6091540.1 diaminohydroxyphosphoribosylaminopyrimidine deaminase/5-amino-6-(5-phosphoribosylamino)uracil reductase [Povalibacter uvarum]